MSGILSRLKRNNQPPKAAGARQPAAPSRPFSPGLGVFLGVILGASILSAVHFESPVKVFLAGEIATQDVTADQTLRFEDREATLRKRDQVAENQPPVFDLSPAPYESLKASVTDVLAQARRTDEDPEKLRASLSEELNVEVSRESFALWRMPEFQDMLVVQLLPWLKEAYARGVAPLPGVFASYKQGILLRELPSGMETLYLDGPGMTDLEMLSSCP